MEHLKRSLLLSQSFLDSLRVDLKNWFNLEIEDIPPILKLLGIKEEYYEIIEKENMYDHISFFVQTEKDTYEVTFTRGDMAAPYPGVNVINQRTKMKDYFYLARKIEVEKVGTYQLR